MASDRSLLAQAEAAGARLEAAERDVLLARADYHTAIRRLHLAGSSLREIADALSLSHQRVQQIVRDAGGSWWQVWRRRGATRDAVCTWCGRPPAEVAKLVAGPKIFICDRCVDIAGRVLEGTPAARPPMTRASAGTRQRCSFCGKRGNKARRLIIGPANACSECLRACREIMDSRPS